MFALLSGNDRTILKYEVPEGPLGKPSGSELLLIQDEETDQYTVLFHPRSKLDENEQDRGMYQVEWRGLLNTCLDKFTLEVETFENDWIREQDATHEAVTPHKLG